MAFCLLILCALQADAQRGMYLEGSVGYLMGVTNDILGPDVQYDALYAPVNSSTIQGTYGEGLGLTLEVGYMLSKNFGVGLATSYVFGQKTLVERSTSPLGEDLSYAKNTRLTLSPCIIVDAGHRSFSPYAKFGVLIPVLGETQGTRSSTDPALLSPAIPIVYPCSTHIDATSIAKGQFSLGFESTVGFRYNLTRPLSLFAQVGYTGLRIKRDTYAVPTATVTLADGSQESILYLLESVGEYQYTVYEKEINQAEYEQYVLDSADDYGTEKAPHKSLYQDANFSTLNIEIGVRYSFGKDEEEF